MTVKISVKPNGPLIVEGECDISRPDGTNLAAGKTRVALCRCGASQNKPFCDASHAAAGFQD